MHRIILQSRNFDSHQATHNVLSNANMMALCQNTLLVDLGRTSSVWSYTTRVFPGSIMQEYSTRLFLASARSLHLVGGKAPRTRHQILA